MRHALIVMAMATAVLFGGAAIADDTATAPGAYLEITLDIDDANRAAAGEVYTTYKQPFLDSIEGAVSKTLLLRDEDVQVLHGFATTETAQAYLKSDLFKDDVVAGLSPYLKSDPNVRVYSAH